MKLSLQGLSARHATARHGAADVLAGIGLDVAAGEQLAVIGPSGAGKTTLLEVLACARPPSAGALRVDGSDPWGLPARALQRLRGRLILLPQVPPLPPRQRVVTAVLAGRLPGWSLWTALRSLFYPVDIPAADAALEVFELGDKLFERVDRLSGGERQRVGLARALVMEPPVLLMDEAFSALDVLTGERLRNEILELWDGGQMPTQAMLVVSHNIEEAVMMADRVLIFASNPGRVRAELPITLPRPRRADSPEVRLLIDEVYRLMTSATTVTGAPEEAPRPHLSDRLPEADVGRMESLLELLGDEHFRGRADLPQLVEESELTDEEVLPLADALHRLGLAQLSGGDLLMTPLGHNYVEGSHEFRREIFGQQLLTNVPLAAFIRHSLEQEADGELKEEPFLKLLSESMDVQEAERVLRVAIEWARHGEVFEYNYHTGMIHLPESDED